VGEFQTLGKGDRRLRQRYWPCGLYVALNAGLVVEGLAVCLFVTDL